MLRPARITKKEAQMAENTEVHQAFVRAWQHSYQAQPDVHTSIKLFSGGAGCLSHLLSLHKLG